MDAVLSTLVNILFIIGGLLILTFLVVIHELGHAIVARRNGVTVEEFGIGFPPRAYSKKLRKLNVLFTLNWLPLGGFVKLKGEHDEDGGKGSYGAAPLWVKAKILLAGVTINWIFAALLLAIVSIFGMPKLFENQFALSSDKTEISSPVTIETINPMSPAERAGLKVGDQITSINNQSVTIASTVTLKSRESSGQTVPVTYIRDGRNESTNVAMNSASASRQGFLGVTTTQSEAPVIKSTWSAPIVGAGLTVQLTYETLKGLGMLFAQLGEGISGKLSGQASEQRAEGDVALTQASQGVAGPVGIIFTLFPQFLAAGILPLMLFTALISLTLAVMNVLPLPALDGGRLYLTIAFRAMKKKLTKEREEQIVGYTFYGLILLVLLITFLDVQRLLTGSN